MKRIPILLLVLILTVVLAGASVFVQSRTSRIVKESKLVDEDFVTEGVPPMVAFTTVALGGFRGLVADMLWLRSTSMQEEGKYYELVQLADWIQKLQPKYSGASAFLGWNMAYNISVACKQKEDRWRWVHRGIETLRTAIAMNPNDPTLYKELGWIYQHKMGNVLDDAQKYYKYEMAKDLIIVYGSHYPDWKALSEAPETETEFRKRYPENYPMWGKIAAWQGVPEKDVDLKSLEKEFQKTGQLPEDLVKKLSKLEVSALDSFFRSAWMRQKYLLQPKVVFEINKKYGELDWLLPESFAIYWAVLGLDHSPDRHSVECSRVIMQSLAVSFRTGRILLAKDNEVTENSFFLLFPNVNVANALRDMYKEQVAENPKNAGFRASYENFMIDAGVTLYTFGRKKDALEYYRVLRNEIKHPDARKYDFDTYMRRQFEEDVRDGGFKPAQQITSALIYYACMNFAFGDYEAADSLLKMARTIHGKYNVEYSMERVKLPPFNEMKRQVTENILRTNPALADALRAEIEDELARRAGKEPAAATPDSRQKQQKK